MSARLWSTGNPGAGVNRCSRAAVGDSLPGPRQAQHRTTTCSSDSASGYLPNRTESRVLKRCLHTHGHADTVCFHLPEVPGRVKGRVREQKGRSLSGLGGAHGLLFHRDSGEGGEFWRWTWWWSHNSVDVLSTSELSTQKWSILCYVCSTIKRKKNFED